MDENICMICLEEVKSIQTNLPDDEKNSKYKMPCCNNFIHLYCLINASCTGGNLNYTCPGCRQYINRGITCQPDYENLYSRIITGMKNELEPNKYESFTDDEKDLIIIILLEQLGFESIRNIKKHFSKQDFTDDVLSTIKITSDHELINRFMNIYYTQATCWHLVRQFNLKENIQHS